MSISRPRTFVIAEAGVNHNGSTEIAMKLIDAAKQAGADAVKFQSFRSTRLVSDRAAKAAYQKRTTGGDESQLAMIRKLELSREAHGHLLAYARKHSIEFLSSPFDAESLDMLCRLGVRLIKIPSGEITNLPFLRRIGKKRKDVILSTGMSTLAEAGRAVDVLLKSGAREIALLHCVTEYPAPFDEINLAAMKTLSEAFHLPVGYSDHTPGIEVPIAAVALGATIIEKHLTLDRRMPGPDHAASIEPEEFAAMVKGIRHVEQAIGNGVKQPARCELKNIDVARKSVSVAIAIQRGEKLSGKNLTIRRPGNGIAPEDFEKVIGRIASRSLPPGHVLTWKDLR